MKRRDFLQSLAALVAVASTVAVLPAATQQHRILYADGVHDDADTLERWFEGEDVIWPDGSPVGRVITYKHFRFSRTLDAKCISPGTVFVGNILTVNP